MYVSLKNSFISLDVDPTNQTIFNNFEEECHNQTHNQQVL
jgi:hypothetical protein